VLLGVGVTATYATYATYQGWPSVVPAWATAGGQAESEAAVAGGALPVQPAVPDRGPGHPVTNGFRTLEQGIQA
jgi:hypothetical protein